MPQRAENDGSAKSYHRNEYPGVAGWVFNIKDARLEDLHFDFDYELKKIKEVYDITTD